MNQDINNFKSESNYGIWFAGVLVLVFPIASTQLSFSFIYGQGHAERPIISFLASFTVGWFGLLIGYFNCLTTNHKNANLKWIVFIGILARLLFLPSNLILENDCYRYVLDGQMVLDGKNPYKHPPDYIKNNLNNFLENKNHSDKANLLLSRIGYPGISTIYPPVAQYAFAIGSFLTPWHWFGQRLIFLLFDIVAIFLIIHILKLLNKPLVWVIIYAWNPLILKEIANSAHLDSLVSFFLLLWVIMSIYWLRKKHIIWLLLASIVYAAAILGKLYPLILMPIGISFVIRYQKNYQGILLFILGVSATLIIGYLPFIDVGIDQLTHGLRMYNREWIQNEGAFYLIQLICEKLPINSVMPIDRLVSNLIVGIIAVYLSLKLRQVKDNGFSLIYPIQIVLLFWFLFLPAVFPWYLISLIAITSLNPKIWIVILSGVTFSYYLSFLISYRDYPDNFRIGIQLIEHIIIWGALIIGQLRMYIFTKQKTLA